MEEFLRGRAALQGIKKGERMIVGLCGAKHSGKSTVAKHLINYCDFERLAFAGKLKAMARTFGLTEEQINGEQKEIPITIRDCTFKPREFMQWLGEEFGRQKLGKNIWVNIWMERAEAILKSPPHRLVADDVRYQNEVEAIKSLGGIVFKIERAGTGSGDSHASETQQLDWDYLIQNDGTIQELTDRIEHALFVVQP